MDADSLDRLMDSIVHAELGNSSGTYNQYARHGDESGSLGMLVLLIPVVLFVTYYLYLRRKSRHKIIYWIDRKFPAAFSEFAFREIQTVLAIAMIKRDRYLLMVKRSRIRHFMKTHVHGAELDVDELIDYFLESKIPVMDLIEWCNRHISYEQKLQTFLLLSEIAIDDELSEREKEYVLFIIQRFAIKSQDIPEAVQSKIYMNQRAGSSLNTSRSRFHFHYEVLELTENASAKEIKESYRRLVKQFHPDSHPDLPAEEKKELSEKFRQVQEAYDTLISH